MLDGYVAKTDPVDESLVARVDERSELRIETLAWSGTVHGSQVHCGQPIETEGQEVLLDAGSQLDRLVVGQDGSRVIAPRRHLADDRQVRGIGVERLADQLVHDAGPVVLGRVDVVDPAVDRRAQHTQRLVAISRRSEDVVSGQLHGAVSDPVHLPPPEREGPRRSRHHLVAHPP